MKATQSAWFSGFLAQFLFRGLSRSRKGERSTHEHRPHCRWRGEIAASTTWSSLAAVCIASAFWSCVITPRCERDGERLSRISRIFSQTIAGALVCVRRFAVAHNLAVVVSLFDWVIRRCSLEIPVLRRLWELPRAATPASLRLSSKTFDFRRKPALRRRITKQSARRATRNHRRGRHIERNISGHHHQLTSLSRPPTHTTDGKHTIFSKNRVQLNIFHRLEDYFSVCAKRGSSSSVDNNNGVALALPTSDVCVITPSALSRGDLSASLPKPARFYLLFRQKRPEHSLEDNKKKSNIATSSSSSFRGLFVDAFFLLLLPARAVHHDGSSKPHRSEVLVWEIAQATRIHQEELFGGWLLLLRKSFAPFEGKLLCERREPHKKAKKGKMPTS